MNKTKTITEFVTGAFAAGKIDAQTMQSLMEHHMGNEWHSHFRDGKRSGQRFVFHDEREDAETGGKQLAGAVV